jgi:drug/metabolite transporter (DMT)-like permease
MTPLALAIILVAACTHATWNLAAKKSGGGLPFVWLTGLVSVCFYGPLAIGYVLWQSPVIPASAWLVVGGSGLIKLAYALLLQRAYQHGDFSLVYPLARGTGPLFSTLAAIVLFHERPTALALAGGATIIASIFTMAGGVNLLHTDRVHLRQGLLYGFICGCCIATLTIWDKHAVAHLHLPPLVYDCSTQVVMCTVLTPFAWPRRADALHAWHHHRWKVFAVALLAPLGYILILTAMTFTPVSYIAPAREISIVIGTLYGAKLLKEADAKRRLFAATGMVAGVIALALG